MGKKPKKTSSTTSSTADIALAIVNKENYEKKLKALPPVVYQQKSRVADLVLSGATKRELVMNFNKLTTKDILSNADRMITVTDSEGNEHKRKQYPSIAVIRKGIGEQKISAIIGKLIINVYQKFNNEMDEDTVFELAFEIQTDYYYLTIEDVYICLKELGRKREHKNMNSNIILREVESYSENRKEMAAQLSLEGHSNLFKADEHEAQRLKTRILHPKKTPVYDKYSDKKFYIKRQKFE